MLTKVQPEQVSVPFHELIFRDVKIHGSLQCGPDEAKRMLDFVAEHKISVRTNTFQGLEKIPDLLELAHGGKMSGKGIVIVDQEQVDAEKQDGIELA